ncbi:MAG: enoyl-CoA hydratase/isomerase family protein [Streptosporangiales bacterium]|nr:enoyl-CoA hydratase/isomerase family protein [Streptosporangiales bacterium]
MTDATDATEATTGPGGPDSDGPAGQGRITLEVTGHTAWVTIANPRKRNAMNAAMWRQVPEVIDAIVRDPEVRTVILTGAGGTFCAGADISELGSISSAELSPAAERALIDCPVPTIALIEGHCVGGGCQLAAACDIRIAGPDARFGITPAKLGIVYPPSSIQRITDIVGASSAKLLLFTADLVNAERAHEMRLIDEIHDNPRKRAESLATTIAERSQLTVQASKELVDLAAHGEPLTDRAHHHRDLSTTTGESTEGINAFLERRPPNFPYRRPPSEA